MFCKKMLKEIVNYRVQKWRIGRHGLSPIFQEIVKELSWKREAAREMQGGIEFNFLYYRTGIAFVRFFRSAITSLMLRLGF